jgi:hypothetical protein
MDPFIEASDLWEDFHDDLVIAIKRALATLLPPGYVARTHKRSYISLVEADVAKSRSFIPDVKITGPARRKAASTPKTAKAAIASTIREKPIDLIAFIEEEFEESFLDIYELQPERKLVTSIEVLSPSNKRQGSPGWQQYLLKRQALLRGKANLVEIDLLRGGTRMPMVEPFPDSPYYLLVARKELAPRCRVWPAFFDRLLQPIPIPLSKPDHDIELSLQPLIEEIYDRSRYGQDIDYTSPLTPPLTGAEAAWLAKRLPAATTARPGVGKKQRGTRS